MSSGRGLGFLNLVERLGNKLPDPIFLFIGATVLIMLISAVGSMLNWEVQPLKPRVAMETVVDASGVEVKQPKLNAQGRPVLELVESGAPVRPKNLLSSTGIYWLISNMVRNFLSFPPLGVVVVCMFGIGLAERVGLFSAAMKGVASIVPSLLLTPTVIFLGMMSHVASDAGYIVLPPLAAGLYVVFKRPPLAGIAAAFSGIAGGFSANLIVSSSDALVGGITETGARTLDPTYTVLPTSNWYFMAASTFLLTFVGWAVTAWITEPRFAAAAKANPELAQHVAEEGITHVERKALKRAGVAFLVVLAIVAGTIAIPGAPLHGDMPAPAPRFGGVPERLPTAPGAFTASGETSERATPGMVKLKPGYTVEAAGTDAAGNPTRGQFVVGEQGAELTGELTPPAVPQPRWSIAIVPIILFVFIVPGLVYGISTGALSNQKDVSRAFIQSMEAMAPVLAMAFFAAQFIESFRYSGLDQMLAYLGGDALAASGLSPMFLLVAVIVLTMIVDMLMSSMSAKWTMLAPIIVPMMMMVGISPELTQAAYRVGDSITNIITPLNTYAIVIIAVMQKYNKSAGMGQLMAMMLPYSITFAIFWTSFLLLYVWLNMPLGPGAPMWYTPGH
jgi:aminobenzoyl-glutamate transport protein